MDFNKKIIVAVDDVGIVLKMLERVLGKEYDVHAFSNGMRALKYLDTITPDMIILDIEMPELDGYELLERIKKKEHLADVPVIFLTSNKDRKNVIKAVAGGAKDYVAKPIEEEILLDKVHALLGDKS